MMKAVDHVSFTVSDLDRSIEFYRLLLQSDPLHVGEDASVFSAQVIGYEHVRLRFAWFALPGSESMFEIFEYLDPPGAPGNQETWTVGNGHIGLVVDDLDAEFRRLANSGATFRHDRPVEITDGPWKGSKAIYMRDPDGITVELMESPPSRAARFADW